MTDNHRVTVRADDITGGKALFAACAIEAGQSAVSELVSSKNVLTEPTKYTIRKDEGVHLDIHTIIKYANHSFQPNVRVVFPPTPRGEDEKKYEDGEDEGHLVSFEAIGCIAAGDEIFFDYTSTERRFACPFVDHVTGHWVGAPEDLL